MDHHLLRTALQAVGAHLAARGVGAAVVVVGGAALSLHGWLRRTTHDVDVIAEISGHATGPLEPPRFAVALQDATRRVARDFGLEPDWFNAVIGRQWQTGLPPGLAEGMEWLSFSALRVGLPSRQVLLSLKLMAAVGQWPQSVHLQDLLALAPTDEELAVGRAWAVTQEASPEFPRWIDEVIEHVRSQR